LAAGRRRRVRNLYAHVALALPKTCMPMRSRLFRLPAFLFYKASALAGSLGPSDHRGPPWWIGAICRGNGISALTARSRRCWRRVATPSGDGSPFRAAPAHPLCPSPVAPPLRLYIPLFCAPDAPSFPRPTTPHARAHTCCGCLQRTSRASHASPDLAARALAAHYSLALLAHLTTQPRPRHGGSAP
jgi:hypothetical protein